MHFMCIYIDIAIDRIFSILTSADRGSNREIYLISKYTNLTNHHGHAKRMIIKPA